MDWRKKKKKKGWRDPQLINETGDCKPREKREVQERMGGGAGWGREEV